MNQYVLFMPVYSDGDELVVETETPDSSFYTNLQQVLDFYAVPYRKTTTGEILVPKHIWRDRDTIWNYTSKANDPAWLEQH